MTMRITNPSIYVDDILIEYVGNSVALSIDTCGRKTLNFKLFNVLDSLNNMLSWPTRTHVISIDLNISDTSERLIFKKAVLSKTMRCEFKSDGFIEVEFELLEEF